MAKDSMIKRKAIRQLEAERDRLKERREKDATTLKVIATKLKEARAKS